MKLCGAFPSPQKTGTGTVHRWTLVTAAYKDIREAVVSNLRLMASTGITLVEVNNATLIQWYNRRTKDQEHKMLEQGLRVPLPSLVATEELPPPIARQPIPAVAPEQQHEFPLPENTAGMASVRRHLQLPSASATITSASGSSLSVTDTPGLPTTFQDLPRTTIWYKKRQEKRAQSGEALRTNKRRREHSEYTYRKCGELRTAAKHTQYYGFWYCADKDDQTFEEWRKEKENLRAAKKRKE